MRFLLTLAVLISLVSPAQAYFSTLDTGDVIEPGKYRAMLSPQVIFNEIDGANLSARFDTGIAEDQSVRAIVGFGEVDFQIGGMYKWIPFPDVEGQPAIGVSAGLLWARIEDENALSLRVHPLISKKVETEIGDFTPYGSIPLGLTDYDDETFVPVQIVGGTEWRTLNFENLTFMTELGLNLSKSFSYLSVGALWYFDEEGIRPKRATESDLRDAGE